MDHFIELGSWLQHPVDISVVPGAADLFCICVAVSAGEGEQRLYGVCQLLLSRAFHSWCGNLCKEFYGVQRLSYLDWQSCFEKILFYACRSLMKETLSQDEIYGYLRSKMLDII